MESGLSTTFELLSSTRNASAEQVLLATFESGPELLAQQAAGTLFERQSTRGDRSLIRIWRSLDQSCQAKIADQRKRFAPAIRYAILSNNDSIKDVGYEAALKIGAFHLIPDLIRLAEDRGYAQRTRAAQAVCELTQAMSQQLRQPRDFSAGDSPHVLRESLVESLIESARRFDRHRCAPLLDALLILADPHSHRFRSFLSDTNLACHRTISETLRSSHEEWIIALLASYLHESFPPALVVDCWNQMDELAFASKFAEFVGPEPPERVRRTLRRITTAPWLPRDLSQLAKLNSRQQCGIANTVEYSSLDRDESFAVIRFFLLEGSRDARRLASHLVANYKSEHANRLLLQAVETEDPQVRSHLIRHLKGRSIPGVMEVLMEALESSHSIVVEAVQYCLDEVNIDRYLASYDVLTPEVRKSTGMLIKKVDDHAQCRILEELNSSTRTRRIRGLAVVDTLEMIDDLIEAIIVLLDDEDHFVRTEVARLLGKTDSEESRMALRNALLDSSASVQAAAERSLRKLTRT